MISSLISVSVQLNYKHALTNHHLLTGFRKITNLCAKYKEQAIMITILPDKKIYSSAFESQV